MPPKVLFVGPNPYFSSGPTASLKLRAKITSRQPRIETWSRRHLSCRSDARDIQGESGTSTEQQGEDTAVEDTQSSTQNRSAQDNQAASTSSLFVAHTNEANAKTSKITSADPTTTVIPTTIAADSKTKMSADDEYAAFLEKANADVSGAGTQVSRSEAKTKGGFVENSVDTEEKEVPAVLKKVDEVYVSETDEKWEVVWLKCPEGCGLDVGEFSFPVMVPLGFGEVSLCDWGR